MKDLLKLVGAVATTIVGVMVGKEAIYELKESAAKATEEAAETVSDAADAVAEAAEAIASDDIA